MRPTQIQFYGHDTFAEVPSNAAAYLGGGSERTILFFDQKGRPFQAFRKLDRLTKTEEFGADLIDEGWDLYVEHRDNGGFTEENFQARNKEVMQLTSGAMAVYCLLRGTHFGKEPTLLPEA